MVKAANIPSPEVLLQTYSIKEVRKILGFHPETVRKMRKSGELPFFFKMRGEWRATGYDLFPWIEAKKSKESKSPEKVIFTELDLSISKELKGEKSMRAKVQKVGKNRWAVGGFGGFYKKEVNGFIRWYGWVRDESKDGYSRPNFALPLVTSLEEAKIAYAYLVNEERKKAFYRMYLPEKAEELGYNEENGKKADTSKMKFSSLCEEWMEQSTRKNKRNDASVLKNLNQFSGAKKVVDISRADVKRYIANSLNAGMEHNTVRQWLQVMRAVFNYGIEMSYLKENPVVSKDFPKEKKGQKIPLDMEEIKLLFTVAEKDYPHMLPVMTTAFMTGMRRGEIETLQWEDVDLESRAIKVKAENNKSGRDKEIPVNDILFPVLVELKEKANGNSCVFTYDNPRFGRETQIPIALHFAEIVERAGLKGRAHFHLMRHTAASMLIRAGADLVSVQYILGHANLSTTQKYAHPYGDGKRIAVKKLEKSLNISKFNGNGSPELTNYPSRG